MKNMNKNFPAFPAPKYRCELCDYNTSKKSHYDEHLTTRKHISRHAGSGFSGFFRLLAPEKKRPIYVCEKCGKQYKTKISCDRHFQKCPKMSSKSPDDVMVSDKELIMMLLRQNTELMEIVKNGTNNINNSHNNSNNKTFNLQFYLNETCKNAMNISDFVSSIKPQIEDLEATGRLGYVEGVSNIILTNLNSLHIHDRPLHCSDFKREVIYIKDNNTWTKEVENKPILTNAIKKIANENIKNINEWRKLHPDCTQSDSKKNDMYLKIVSNSISGTTKEEGDKNINKIITNIAKEVIIDKHSEVNNLNIK